MIISTRKSYKLISLSEQDEYFSFKSNENYFGLKDCYSFTLGRFFYENPFSIWFMKISCKTYKQFIISFTNYNVGKGRAGSVLVLNSSLIKRVDCFIVLVR